VELVPGKYEMLAHTAMDCGSNKVNMALVVVISQSSSMDTVSYKIGVAMHVDGPNDNNNMVARKSRKKPKRLCLKTYR
jgi:hypothetical protein